jgi:hypothetical protein
VLVYAVVSAVTEKAVELFPERVNRWCLREDPPCSSRPVAMSRSNISLLVLLVLLVLAALVVSTAARLLAL